MVASVRWLLVRTEVSQYETPDPVSPMALALHHVSIVGLTMAAVDRAPPWVLLEPALGHAMRARDAVFLLALRLFLVEELPKTAFPVTRVEELLPIQTLGPAALMVEESV